jgi:hypothetical protein
MLDGMAAGGNRGGAPATRMFATISPTSYHRQWSGACFKISGEERRAVWHLTIYIVGEN